MSLKNASLDQVRVNICNNQTYTMTAALALTTLGNAVLQGFASSVGDLGKATFSTNLNSATNFTFSGTVNATFIDLIFVCTAVANANHLVISSATVDTVWIRCVFHGARGLGFAQSTSAGTAYMIECEAYDCNKSNTAATAGFVSSMTVQGCGMYCYNCYSHDNAGSNAHGFAVTNLGNLIMVNCIADTNGGSGVLLNTTSGGLMCMNCNFYNNTADGITISHTAANVWPVLINNNFLKNGGKGVNVTTASQGGILYNNGRGAGTQANGGVDVLSCVVDTGTDITYASNVTPWNAPTTGDFTTLRSSTAFGAGRGVFVETDGTNTGTLSYPDIGASQAVVAGSGGLRLAGSGGLAA